MKKLITTEIIISLFCLSGWAVPFAYPFELNINCGGGAYITTGGKHYLADRKYSTEAGYGYVDGNAGSTGDSIAATDDDALYQSERWGVSEYRFNVPDGNYNVRLQFCEIHYQETGKRVFDIFIEGKKIWSGLDIYDLLGHDKALDYVFSYIKVDDGQLNITTAITSGASQISAICVWDGDPRDVGMSDDAFVDMYEKKLFNWFDHTALAPYYVCADWSPYDDSGAYGINCNISGVGFQLAAYPIGVHRGWMSYQEAYKRTHGLLNAVDLMSRDEYNTRMHWVYKMEPWRDWWFGGGTPPPEERSLWDNGNLFLGVVFAAQYFRGTPLEIPARRLYEEVKWYKWDLTSLGYNEGMAAVILGARSPTHPIYNPYEAWNNQTPYYENSLFYFQWFTNFVDFRNIVDGNGRNHFEVAREATAYDRDCCISDWINQPDEFQTYDYDSWGLTAVATCSTFEQLRPCSGLYFNDSGSVCPIALAGSMPFLPTEVINAMKHLYWRFYQQGWPSYMPPIISTYGFLDSYNIGTAWETERPCAIPGVSGYDYGGQLLGIENYRSGFVWDYFMQSSDIIRGLFKMGFRGPGVTEPPFKFETNLAEGKPTSASSNETSDYVPQYATDHKMLTRWSSQYSDPQWIMVDLEANYDISQVRLLWEVTYAKSYEVQFSNNASDWCSLFQTDAGDGGVDEINFSRPINARYVRIYCEQRATQYGYSLWEIEIYGKNLAQDKYTYASSQENDKFRAEFATDGYFTSRWNSDFSDPQWICVDLGAIKNIHRVVLHWEAAYAKSYRVQVSTDATHWADAFSTSAGDGGVDNITFGPIDARYVRIYGTERGTPYDYSLWEFEVFVTPSVPSVGNWWMLK